jgi:hypothetical protein
MSGRYRAAFSRYGLDVVGADLGVVADAVRASRLSAALIAGVSEWFAIDPRGPHLRQLLDRLDPDPDRAAIRSAIQAGDAGRVRALVGALDGAKTPAWFAVSVGYHQMVPPLDGVRLMSASWRTHPASYLLAYRITRRLWGTGEERIAEMLAWARVAVALRPDSPFAHNRLSNAWTAMRDWGEAEASARRAIELGRNYPRCGGGHVTLGNVLSAKGGSGRRGGELPRRARRRTGRRHDVLQPGTGLQRAGRPGRGCAASAEGLQGNPEGRLFAPVPQRLY